MDDLAFKAANVLAGNIPNCEGLEIVVPSAKSPLAFSVLFHVETVIAVTGADAMVRVDGNDARMWSRITIHAGSKVAVYGAGAGIGSERSGGLRVYMAIWKGFPDIPMYLDSKSTSMGNGGYQVSKPTCLDLCRVCSATVGTCSPNWRCHPDRISSLARENVEWRLRDCSTTLRAEIPIPVVDLHPSRSPRRR